MLGLSRTPWLGPCALGSALVGLWCLYSVPRLLYRVLSGCEEAMLAKMGVAFVGMSMRLSRGATPFFLCWDANELGYDLRQVWSAFELC